jgi:two-component system sensor histidine kinase/response regulator
MPDVDGFMLASEIASDKQLAAPRIILLTSAGLVRQRAGPSFAAALTKPVKQSELLDAIVTAFATPVPAAAVPKTRRASPARTQTARPLRVLVAEDNATNQKLVLALLKQRGHHGVVVGNGRLAVEAAAAEKFDVILMDVQMPEMGGLEATSAIRAAERDSGKRTPIIALTAHVMAGDREECLAAGMDGFVAKPLRPAELFAAIDQFGPASSFPAPGPATQVDGATLLASLGGTTSLLADVVTVFLADIPGMLEQLKQAAAAKNISAMAAAAHAIKGSVGLFTEGDALLTARKVEQLARDGDVAAATRASVDLEKAVEALNAELRQLIEKR